MKGFNMLSYQIVQEKTTKKKVFYEKQTENACEQTAV